jgi:phytanoyl-CoA hydroxylase
MLTDEQVKTFRERGYLYYGPVLSPGELADLRAALTRVQNGESEASPESIGNMQKNEKTVVMQIVNIWQAEPAFYRHLFQEKIVPLVAQLMDTDTVRVWHDQVQIKPPVNGGPTLWHQDHPYWPVIQPADLVSAWVAIEDADEANGCMSMVPGSHKWGPHKGGTIGTNPETWGPDPDLSQLPEGIDITPVPVPVPAGAVVFHHCLTWHGAPPNRTERSRPAIAVHYMPGYTRYEPEGKTHLVEKHIHVAPGATLTGDHFPTVYENGQMLTPDEAAQKELVTK